LLPPLPLFDLFEEEGRVAEKSCLAVVRVVVVVVVVVVGSVGGRDGGDDITEVETLMLTLQKCKTNLKNHIYSL
jgi:hypothetical protein